MLEKFEWDIIISKEFWHRYNDKFPSVFDVIRNGDDINDSYTIFEVFDNERAYFIKWEKNETDYEIPKK